MKSLWKNPKKELPAHNQRVIAFSDCHPVGHEMRFRIISGQFVKRAEDVTLWADCEELLKLHTIPAPPAEKPPKKKLEKTVKPKMRFFYDQLHEVVRKHETIPGDWWCRGVEDEIGLWTFSEETILKNQRPS